MNDLARFRLEIDGIDDQIVDLLARRFAICRKVAVFKLAHHIPVRLPERIDQVKTRCADRAVASGVDRDFAVALYHQIIEETCRAELVEQAATAAAEDGPG
ncbi:MAG: chorismate mutase [Candidatus Hydrogenedens sp.]|nr:chorismate mutase [Candidatus Hydrogenedens sp.]